MKNWTKRTPIVRDDIVMLGCDHTHNPWSAEIVIRLDDLEYLLTKAVKSKGKKATDCGGAVVVRIHE